MQGKMQEAIVTNKFTLLKENENKVNFDWILWITALFT